MGTKVQIENYLPGHYSMRDLSREPNDAGWPSCYSEGNLPNGQFYYGFLPRAVADSHSGYDKDVLKQTMLEHEAVFKNQVYELHRVYRVQRDLMDEARRKEQFKRQIPYEMSSSSSPVPPQLQSEDAQRWNGSSVPLASPVFVRPLMSGPDNTQSSPNSVKGKSIQSIPIPFQNSYSPKNSEVSESRPTKFRRRMLDLQLPADEYIDTDEVEQFGGAKAFDLMSSSPDKNKNSASANGKMFLNYSGKTECQGDASSSDLHTSNPKTLADLNEPLHVEEMTTVSSLDFLGHGGSHRDLSTRLLNSSEESCQNSKKGGMNGTLNNFQETRANGRDWLCYALDSEQYKGSVRSINQGIHPEKAPAPSQAVHALPDQSCQHPAFLSNDHLKRDQWTAKYVGITEKSDRSYASSAYFVSEPITAPHASSQPGLFHSSKSGKSWDQSASSWGKPNNFLSPKPAAVQTSPLLSSANLSKSPQSSAHSNDLFANKWNLNKSPVVNPAFGSELPVKNGFYQGPSAAYKELPGRFPPAGLDYGSCNYNEKKVPCASNGYFKATSCFDVNHPVREMNLNVALPNGLSDDYVNPHTKITGKECKPEDPLAALPWLRGKGACNNEAETLKKGLNSSAFSQDPSVLSSSYEVDTTVKKPDISRKILGVSIYENPPFPKENSAVINPQIYRQSGHEEIKSSKRKGGFDINIPCELSDSEMDKMSGDEAVVVQKIKTESANIRNLFDLNSCITEEETPCGASPLDNSITVMIGTGIDLEAPAAVEDEDVVLPVQEMKEPDVQQPELQPKSSCNDGECELLESAAAAIVAISSFAIHAPAEKITCLPPEAEGDDPLHWFVDVACSSETVVDSQMIEADGLLERLDDFESMILRLKECTVEEYFPKPSIPEFPIVETTTCVLTTRTRKGQARRGRQRRDFQRDILPGLTTLSRHEVTEDLQTFGGLMRATGHSWHSGPNRRNATRNGCGRGRRRTTATAPVPVVANAVCALPLKQQQQQQLPQQQYINNTEVGLEDRSLTGWGKTTRRPRRQRYPAGNPAPPVPLT